MITRKSHLAQSLLYSFVLAAGAAAQAPELGTVPDFVPDGADGNNFIYSMFFETPRTFQMILDPSTLDQIPAGAVITSIAFRLDVTNTDAWPPVVSAFGDYEIRIGRANRTAANMSTTFATNVSSGTDVLVRDGLFSPLPGVYSAGATAPNAEAWGPTINLQTGFYYTGGGLVLTVRHSGQPGGVSPPVDGADGVGIRGLFGDGQNAATGSLLNAGAVVRIGFVRDTEQTSGVNKVYVGEEYATVESDVGSLNNPFANNPRTFGMIVAPGELDSFGTGTSYTGFSLRNDNSSTVPANSPWPAIDHDFGAWFLQLSRSQNAVGAMDAVIANNVGSDAKTVYNSTLTIPALSMLPDPGSSINDIPAPFSFEVFFSSRFEYRGGPLFMLFRSSGYGLPDQFRTDSNVSGFVQSRWSPDTLAANLPNYSLSPAFRFSADAAQIAPTDLATSAGGSFTNAILSSADATHQTIIAASELTHIPVGSLINSFALRRLVAQGNAWPAEDSASLNYEVWVSTAARTPATMSTSFATNEGADKTLVRDGALGVPRETYPSAASGASSYGPPIVFQRAFVYKGGDLALTVRTSGVKGVSSANFDGVLGSPLARSVTINGQNGVVGGFTAAPVIKLGYIASGVVAGAESGGRRLFDSNRTHQIIYSASSLADIPAGAKLTGMSFRNRLNQDSIFYPTSETVLPRFDVSLSTAAHTTGTMSAVIADNEGDDRIDARTGPLTLPAGIIRSTQIPPTATPDEFTHFIDFPQAFFYRGGDLAVTIRSESPLSAMDGVDVATTSSSALATMRQDSSTADAVSLGTFVAPFIIRFAYTPPSSCPADLNKDGFVTDDDFQIFIVAYNTLDCDEVSMSPGCPADLNYDGVVDDADFQIFVVAYNDLLCP